MVIKVISEFNGNSYIKHCSDSNLKIKKTGTDEIYIEAYDILDSNFSYEETNELIE